MKIFANPQRRLLVQAGGALLAAPALMRARAQGRLMPTPTQTEGPFYPIELPADSDHDLLKNGSLDYRQGTPAWLAGRVIDTQGRPLAGAVVEIWQCDQQGHYHHPGDGGRADPAFQGFGRSALDTDGRYRFRTLRPVPYSGRTPHIHLKVRDGTHTLLTTQLYVEGERHNEQDFLWRRLDAAQRRALTVPFVSGRDGLMAQFDIVIA